MAERSKITLLTGYQHKDMKTAAVAGGSDGEEVIFKNDSGAKMVVEAVKFTAAAAVTGNDTNNFTLSVLNKTRTKTVASKAYATGVNIAKWGSSTLTNSTTADDLVVNSGDVLTLAKVEAGSGLALPAGLLSIQFRYSA